MNVTEAEAMLATAERHNRVHAVDHEFRFVPARRALKRLIDAGEIGEPFLVRIAQLRGGRPPAEDSWWRDRARGGGVLQAIGSHFIDAVRLWIGPFAAVQADLRSVAMQGATAEDTASVSFRLQNGVTGSINLSQGAKGGPNRVEVYGPKGSLFIEGTMLYRSTGGDPEEIAPDDAVDQGRLEDPRLGPFVELAQRVVDRINGKDSGPFPTFADGLEVQRVMDAIRRSSNERREVAISEI
jgi:predicted dehydrogenase